jgi:hypothetical protein
VHADNDIAAGDSVKTGIISLDGSDEFGIGITACSQHAIALLGIQIVRVVRRIELDITDALRNQPLDFTANDFDEIGQKFRSSRIRAIGDAFFIARDKKVGRSRQSDFEQAGRPLLQKREFIGSQVSLLFQFSTGRKSDARLAHSAGPFPLELHSLRNESIDGLRHIREPAGPAHFAVGENIHSDLALAR